MESAEIIELVEQEVKSLSTYLDSEDYTNALNDALRETGWSCPTSVSFQIHWIKMRAKRHIFFYLASESARKFKAKQFHLGQKFDHYMSIIKYMDEEFEKAKEEFPDQFTDANLEELLGSKIDAGFAYDKFGNEITYDVNQEVIITPSD